jgi:hypothetical protein
MVSVGSARGCANVIATAAMLRSAGRLAAASGTSGYRIYAARAAVRRAGDAQSAPAA